MANEVIWLENTEKQLESNGAAVTNDAISAAMGTTLDAADTDQYPWATFVLECEFGTAPDQASVIELIMRPLNIQGTTDAPVPTATFIETRVGVFAVKDVTTANQLYIISNVQLPHDEGEFYLFNRTGQTISSTWRCWVTPKSLQPSA